jgi:hypothetical protein
VQYRWESWESPRVERTTVSRFGLRFGVDACGGTVATRI